MKRNLLIAAISATALLYACTNYEDYSYVPSTSPSGIVSSTPMLNLRLFNKSEWNGIKISHKNLCQKDGGDNATSPIIEVTGIPKETNYIVAEFNDESCDNLATDGGLGAIGTNYDGGRVFYIQAINSESTTLPQNMKREDRHKGIIGTDGKTTYPSCTGDIATTQTTTDDMQTYLAPCSGKKHHEYSVNIKAVKRGWLRRKKGEKILATGYISLGKD